MGQIAGTYTGPSVSFFALANTSSQSGISGSVGGEGAHTWGYEIHYTNNGFTDSSWEVWGTPWTEDQLLAANTQAQYNLAVFIEKLIPGCASTYSYEASS